LYTCIYGGHFIKLSVADLDSILISKALKAPIKNRALITDYLARGASSQFLKMAKQGQA
jgi:hypothetical protein